MERKRGGTDGCMTLRFYSDEHVCVCVFWGLWRVLILLGAWQEIRSGSDGDLEGPRSRSHRPTNNNNNLSTQAGSEGRRCAPRRTRAAGRRHRRL